MLRFYDTVLDAPTKLRDGTHRAASLDATWKRFARVAPAAGITRIADITGLDTLGIPVFAAIRPMGLSLATQQGKGISPEAARVSALMESLETYSAEHIEREAVRDSYRALSKRTNVVDVRRLPRALPAALPAERPGDKRRPADKRRRGDKRRRVAPTRRHAMRRGGRLDLDARWRWVEGFDLTAGEPILVPREAVTLDTTFTKPPTFDISSNGLASGNVLVEAIVHGLCEVLERDAESAWRRAGGDRRLVLDTITDPACRALIDRITATGARVFIWDLAAESGIAAIGAAIMEDPNEPAWRTLGFYQGFGAHLLPEIAIARALTEAAQTRLTYIAGARDDFFPFDYARATDPELLADLWQRLAAPCDEPVIFDDLPRRETRGLGEDLEALVGLCEQVIVVDLTHRKLRVPVVKVIVPGRATDVEALG
ncbi:MAG TPA: YcaO-like family protein [Kofleriaceae bacterium]|nr:YcaO-like family protein [Kofleriaceae bacterium]